MVISFNNFIHMYDETSGLELGLDWFLWFCTSLVRPLKVAQIVQCELVISHLLNVLAQQNVVLDQDKDCS